MKRERGWTHCRKSMHHSWLLKTGKGGGSVFVGHYSASFAAKRIDSRVPLWLLFLAAQFLDVVWSPLVMLGVERMRIVPGITASNALDLYYMPYTHSLVG